MDVFKDINVDDIRVDVVRYCQRYLDFGKPNPTEIWHEALLLCKGGGVRYDGVRYLPIFWTVIR